MQDTPSIHIVILLLLIFTAVNLLILDIKVFTPTQSMRISDISVSVTPATTNNQLPVTTNNANSCPSSCISLINEVSKPTSTIGSPTNNSSLPITNNPITREYFIPLGSGTTSKSEWEDLLGTDTLINPANYGTIKEAQFSVAVKNPTKNGAVEVRLYNVTDKYVVYGSTISTTEAEQTVTSGTFAFPTGAKLYRLQARSALSYTVSVENARLRLMAQ